MIVMSLFLFFFRHLCSRTKIRLTIASGENSSFPPAPPTWISCTAAETKGNKARPREKVDANIASGVGSLRRVKEGSGQLSAGQEGNRKMKAKRGEKNNEEEGENASSLGFK
jgi:hypothetical protein